MSAIPHLSRVLDEHADARLQAIAARLEIPDSHYDLAVARYKSLGEWLHRGESTVRQHSPEVYSQGSFRYGTGVCPFDRKAGEYDLDLVCRLQLTKADLTQAALKDLLGREIRAYAAAHAIKAPVEEKKRCWRLEYADEVSFHMDVLPAVPEDRATILLLVSRGVLEEQALPAIAITDTRHPQYQVIASDWNSSNPEGFARWFREQARPGALERIAKLLEGRFYASVEAVPTFQFKAPLQRAIQLLKRHRDVWFHKQRDVAPISMIITTLAARAYQGERNLAEALATIIERMSGQVSRSRPRVPNPVNPKEDFADRWASDSRLETSFHAWHLQFATDFQRLAGPLDASEVLQLASKTFGVQLPADVAARIASSRAPAPSVPRVQILSPARPWQRTT